MSTREAVKLRLVTHGAIPSPCLDTVQASVFLFLPWSLGIFTKAVREHTRNHSSLFPVLLLSLHSHHYPRASAPAFARGRLLPHAAINDRGHFLPVRRGWRRITGRRRGAKGGSATHGGQRETVGGERNETRSEKPGGSRKCGGGTSKDGGGEERGGERRSAIQRGYRPLLDYRQQSRVLSTSEGLISLLLPAIWSRVPYGKILTPLRGIVTRQRAAAPGCGAQKTLPRVILPRCGGAVPGCRGVTPVQIIRMTSHRVNMTLWGVKTPPINRTEERSYWLLTKPESSIYSTHQVLYLQYLQL